MNKSCYTLLAAALLLAGSGLFVSVAHAQGSSRLDLGAYGGVSWTSSWLEVKENDFVVGTHPVFGAIANGWLQPRLGLRLHGGYIPAELPEPSETPISGVPDGRLLNIWLYDLSLAYRPLAGSPSRFSTAYFFAGGGGLTADVAGDSSTANFPGVDTECVFPYILSDACLSQEPGYATVGQGTIGAGMTLLPLTRRVGLFGEVALHVYDSPFHERPNPLRGVDECNAECVGDNGLAFTPRLVAGLLLGLGRPRPVPAPVGAVPLPPPPPPVLPPLPPEQPVRLCVLVDDLPHYVDGRVIPETGDTVVVLNGERRPLAEVRAPAPTFAEGRPFFIANEAIPFGGRRYVPFGLPRPVAPGELRRVGDYEGIGVFVEADAVGLPSVLYLPARPDCEYQPYQLQEGIRVRG